jgi:hypothetical protein
VIDGFYRSDQTCKWAELRKPLAIHLLTRL